MESEPPISYQVDDRPACIKCQNLARDIVFASSSAGNSGTALVEVGLEWTEVSQILHIMATHEKRIFHCNMPLLMSFKTIMSERIGILLLIMR
jgi:hypothetical protein